MDLYGTDQDGVADIYGTKEDETEEAEVDEGRDGMDVDGEIDDAEGEIRRVNEDNVSKIGVNGATPIPERRIWCLVYRKDGGLEVNGLLLYFEFVLGYI